MECQISNYSVKRVSKDYKQIGIQKFDNDYYEKEIENLKHQLEMEKSRSSYWNMKANGEKPVLMGTREEIGYIFNSNREYMDRGDVHRNN